MNPVDFIQSIAHALGIPMVLVGTWIVMGLLLIFALVARRALNEASDPIVPDEGISLRSVSEAIVEWIDTFVREVTELHGARRYVGFFGSLFLFILFANMLGLIPGMAPPTADSDLTFALGVICFGFYIYQGFRLQGPGYLKTFLGPILILTPMMLPIEIADNLFRPFSLGVRLYANMFADHTLLHIFTGLTYLIIPIAFYALGLLVCIVQALVFMVLAMSYVRMASGAGH